MTVNCVVLIMLLWLLSDHGVFYGREEWNDSVITSLECWICEKSQLKKKVIRLYDFTHLWVIIFFKTKVLFSKFLFIFDSHGLMYWIVKHQWIILCGNLLQYTLIFSNIKYSTEIFSNGYCIHSYIIKLGDFYEIEKPTPQKIKLMLSSRLR